MITPYMDEDTKHKIATIYSFLSKNDTPIKADAIFVATGSSLEQPKKASELYKEGYADKIFTVGKRGTFSSTDWDDDEASMYREILVEQGVDEESIYANPVARNSREEAKMSIEWMRKIGIDPKTVIIVDTPKHQLREYLTFKNFFPEINFINVPSGEEIEFDQDTLDRVVAEVDRLIRYPKQGLIAEVKIPDDVYEAYRSLKKKVVNSYISKSATIM